jgi:hypothetical protein
MGSVDRVEEWRRLQELYATLTEGELEAVAEDGYELTDVAKQALQSEILRRGLDIRLKGAPSAAEPDEKAGDFDPSGFDLAVVNRAWNSDEARQMLGILRDAGIPAYLGPDNLEDVDAFHSAFDGGVDVKVREVDHQRALHALSQALPREPDAKTDSVARCPKCHSPDIVFQGLDEESVPNSFATSKFNWICDSCGHSWKDDGVEEQA